MSQIEVHILDSHFQDNALFGEQLKEILAKEWEIESDYVKSVEESIALIDALPTELSHAFFVGIFDDSSGADLIRLRRMIADKLPNSYVMAMVTDMNIESDSANMKGLYTEIIPGLPTVLRDMIRVLSP